MTETEKQKTRVYRILITGAESYVGSAVEAWLRSMPERYTVTVSDVTEDAWKNIDFSCYDVVYHVAGLVHRSIGRGTEAEYALYDKVNRKLTEDIAHKAKEGGVQQFIFMSSMSVYSGCKETCITTTTVPVAKEPYGYSKLRAEEALRHMETEAFRVVILRPPMIYGDGCKGNYPRLKRLAGRLPVFPKVRNERSMLADATLCRFVQLMIDNRESGVFFPQDKEYICTSELVERLAQEQNHRIFLVPGFGWLIRLCMHLPGKTGAVLRKLFGNLTYAQEMSSYKGGCRE